MKRMQMALAGLAVAAVAGLSVSSADARSRSHYGHGHRGHGGSHYSIGFNVGGGYPAYAPAYYAPRPVVYPAYVAPAYYAPAPYYGGYGPSCGGSSFSFSYSR